MSIPSHLWVNERFGPTIQGEGRRAGELATFLRLAGCNLSCAWCDTPYSWDWGRFDHATESHRETVASVAVWAAASAGRLVISGGEPLLQSAALTALVARLPQGHHIDLETNGTRALPVPLRMRLDTITASPKIIPSADQDLRLAAVHPSIEFSIRVDLKFVCSTQADLAAVLTWLRDRPHVDPSRVWLMPEGTTPQAIGERTPALLAAAAEHGFNFTSRLHVLAFGDVRGH